MLSAYTRAIIASDRTRKNVRNLGIALVGAGALVFMNLFTSGLHHRIAASLASFL